MPAAGVSACLGAGDQGNADRDTGTDRSASAGTWLACFESTGIYASYGVVQREASPRERLGQRQAILAVTLSREVLPHESGAFE